MNAKERNRERKEEKNKNCKKTPKIKPEEKRQKLLGRPACCPPFSLSVFFFTEGGFQKIGKI